MDGMPWLGDDVGPGSDLRFKVTQDVAAGEDACVADREQQAVLLGEIVVVGRDLALLTGPDPGGGLDEQPPRRPPLPPSLLPVWPRRVYQDPELQLNHYMTLHVGAGHGASFRVRVVRTFPVMRRGGIAGSGRCDFLARRVLP